MRTVGHQLIWVLAAVLAVAGCSSSSGGDAAGSSNASPTVTAARHGWVEDEVKFVADGLTIHGTYRYLVMAMRLRG